jgi:carboxylate-amine ligase
MQGGQIMRNRIFAGAGQGTSLPRYAAITHSSPSPLEVCERQLRTRFESVAPFTVGAEEEFLLVDPESLALVPEAENAMGRIEAGERVKGEFRAAQLETATPICVAVPDLERELNSSRRLVVEALAGSALLVAAGTHPDAPAPGRVSDGRRFQELALANPWAARHALTCGLHVHVAVGGGAERTLAIYNSLRNYLPELVALGANAPFYRGEDSGLATVRPKLNACWQRSGVPPAFTSWTDLASFVLWARNGDAFPDDSHHWWDLRLNVSHGTIELRACDAQTSVEDAATAAALVQSLVVELATRYDAGEQLPVASSERIAENMWLATRDGVSGWLIDLETGRRVLTAERLQQLVEQLAEAATSIGCEQQLRRVTNLAAMGGRAGWQRDVHEAGGMESLIVALAAETTRSTGDLTTIRQDGASDKNSSPLPANAGFALAS